jgi:hypothetical protein
LSRSPINFFGLRLLRLIFAGCGDRGEPSIRKK